MGEFNVLVKFCDQSKNLRFLITNTRNPSRLRLDFMNLFGIASSNINPTNQVGVNINLSESLNTCVQSLLKRFCNVFKGGSVMLNLIEDVKPFL